MAGTRSCWQRSSSILPQCNLLRFRLPHQVIQPPHHPGRRPMARKSTQAPAFATVGFGRRRGNLYSQHFFCLLASVSLLAFIFDKCCLANLNSLKFTCRILEEFGKVGLAHLATAEQVGKAVPRLIPRLRSTWACLNPARHDQHCHRVKSTLRHNQRSVADCHFLSLDYMFSDDMPITRPSQLGPCTRSWGPPMLISAPPSHAGRKIKA
jgi:hypothetical protein